MLLAYCSPSQRSIGNYTVDSSIKREVDEQTVSMDGATTGAMTFTIYKDNSIISSTDSTPSTVKGIQGMTYATLEGDTINITGFLGMSAGFGFHITLFKDTCIVRHLVKSDVAIYKLHKSDSLSFGIYVPCASYKLTFVNKPQYKKGEIVEGIVELQSDTYFEGANGEEHTYSVRLKGYFKTSPLKSVEGK